MSIIQDTVYDAGGVAPAIQNSLRFRASASAYLSRTFGTPTDTKKWTFSTWVKRGKLGGDHGLIGLASTVSEIVFTDVSGDNIYVRQDTSDSYLRYTSSMYRDPAAWLHIVFVFDSANATADDRCKVYVNGTALTLTTTTTVPLNATSRLNSNAASVRIGNSRGTLYLDGLMAQVCFVDGQALTPSAFAAADATSGEWKPKSNAAIRTAVGTWGNNGFLLDFSNTASTTTLGYDHKASDTDTTGNNWTCNNISLTNDYTYDAFIDSPNNGSSATQPVGNYATLNAVEVATSTLSEGNLKLVATAAYTNGRRATIGFPVGTGKWYWEVKSDSATGAAVLLGAGVAYETANVQAAPDQAGIYGYYWQSNRYRAEATSETNEGAATLANTDVICCAFDASAGKLWVRLNNGSWYNGSGDPAAGTSPSISGISTTAQIHPAIIYAYSSTAYANFGQRPFAYTPPTGFKALCTANLGTPAIDKPSLHFDAKTYTGNASTQSISGLGFQPSLVWMKSRGRAVDHAIYDAPRGVEKRLESNNADTEVTGDTTGLTAFNSDGWTMGALDQINNTTATNSYVGWAWKANGAGSTNTQPANSATISSVYSTNTTAGISIVTYTGTGTAGTVYHGLGAVPKLIIVKVRANGGANTAWHVYHADVGNADYLSLNTTAAKQGGGQSIWNTTSPTSTLFSIGSSSWPQVNISNGTYVAYCFAEIPGFSKFGSYTGNGSADGPFVFCGFRPRWILMKNASAAGTNWVLFDSVRDTYNLMYQPLDAGGATAESSLVNTWQIDATANGFKVRNTSSSNNGSTNTIIYAAFAESPFQYANAR